MQLEPPNFIVPTQAYEDEEEEIKININQRKDKVMEVEESKGKVSVKYQKFQNCTACFKHISLSAKNILAMSTGNEGSKVKFMAIQQNDLNLTLTQIKPYRSITMRHSFLQWSPNGQYLAVGGSHLAIWKWEDDQIDLLKEYAEDFYDIYGFAWAPNSQKFAVSSINSQLALVIKEVKEQNKPKVIKDVIMVSLRWDPFNKYLACLSSENIVHIYSCNNWSSMYSIDMSTQSKRKAEPKTLIMKIDWSPDFRYILVPSLESKPLSYIAALERNKTFNIKGLFLGPFSTINCIKFNPNLYQLPTGQIISAFAMGDSQGSIAIWLVGQKYKSKKPLMLLKASQYQEAVIQNLSWNNEGNVLYASTFNDYIITISFQHLVFGRKLDEQQKCNILQDLYGSTKAIETQFRVFRMGDTKPQQSALYKNEAEISKTPPVKNQYVFTNQQVISLAGNKKKIQPSILVKASQKQAVQRKNNIISSTQKPLISLLANKISQQNRAQQHKQQLIGGVTQTQKLIVQNIISLSVLNKKQLQYRISQTRHLQIQSKQTEQLILVYHKGSDQRRQLLSTISIPGKINYYEYSNQVILVYSSQGYVYLFSQTGIALELPMLVGQLHLIKIKNMDLLTISTTCNLRFFNLKNKKLYINTNIIDLVGNNLKVEANKILTKAIEHIIIGDNHELTIQLINKKKYLLNKLTLAWHLVPNQIYSNNQFQEQARFKEQYPSIDETLAKFSKSFFQAMIKPPAVSSIQQLQYNLIYFKQHNPNYQKFSLTLINYIKQLVKLRMDGKLRQVIVKYFVQKSQGDYLRTNRVQLVNSLKQINSKIIAELSDLGLLD